MSEFLDIHKSSMETLGFWTEEYRESIKRSIENRYKTNIIKEWAIVDFVINGDRVLVKWAKRYYPLTNDQLLEIYGRTPEE